MMIAEISAAFGATRAALELAAGAQKLAISSEVKMAIADIQTALLDTQGRVFDANSKIEQLLSERDELAVKVQKMEAWEAEASRYELKEVAGGIFLYSLKPERANGEPIQNISNLFEDQTFSGEEIGRALNELLPLIIQPCSPEERAVLYKLIAILAYAKAKEQPLHGVAD